MDRRVVRSETAPFASDASFPRGISRRTNVCRPEPPTARLKREIGTDYSMFQEAAKKHSKCPSGKSGGSLGTFGPGMMVSVHFASFRRRPFVCRRPFLCFGQSGWGGSAARRVCSSLNAAIRQGPAVRQGGLRQGESGRRRDRSGADPVRVAPAVDRGEETGVTTARGTSRHSARGANLHRER